MSSGAVVSEETACRVGLFGRMSGVPEYAGAFGVSERTMPVELSPLRMTESVGRRFAAQGVSGQMGDHLLRTIESIAEDDWLMQRTRGHVQRVLQGAASPARASPEIVGEAVPVTDTLCSNLHNLFVVLEMLLGSSVAFLQRVLTGGSFDTLEGVQAVQPAQNAQHSQHTILPLLSLLVVVAYLYDESVPAVIAANQPGNYLELAAKLVADVIV
eukprot:TRINITY_DN66318_c0_g1_i1.p1 TRINITY_DN66318_c0_g1~~TRINITY_DN66318_c0_g1_i1.p1  ORF type:complete len:214 (+),score=54.03 TRINITY_DN66318_c0_g1_i1:370-1011(+)